MWKAAIGLALTAGSLGALRAAPVPDSPAPRGPAEYWQARASLDNLHRLAGALHTYVDEHGHFPTDVVGKDGKPLLSWRVVILPYLDQEYLHSQFKLDEPWDGPNNRRLLAFMPRVFRSAVQNRKSTDTYCQVVAGPGAVWEAGKKVGMLDITDGTSNTLLLIEAGPPVPWTKPADIPYDPNGKLPELAGPYTDALHVAAADGSTFRMKPKPDPDRLEAFITRAGGEMLDADLTKDLRAAPARPVTESERKQLAEQQQYAKKELERAREYADERYELEQQLRKLGHIPQRDPATVGTLEELEEMVGQFRKTMWADMTEVKRLTEELRKKDPKAAERIAEEFHKRSLKRVMKEEGVQEKK